MGRLDHQRCLQQTYIQDYPEEVSEVLVSLEWSPHLKYTTGVAKKSNQAAKDKGHGEDHTDKAEAGDHASDDKHHGDDHDDGHH